MIIPSKTHHHPWIRVHPHLSKSSEQYNPKDLTYVGKWLLFLTSQEGDIVWPTIVRLTRQGLLGPESKISTAYRTQYATPGMCVICLYTYNYNDIEDVQRIRHVLRTLGYRTPLCYKTDISTNAKRYATKGNPVIQYYE